jgi:uncharacterized damage-inducible protein DinB
MTRRPQPNEYGPYYDRYISKVETGDINQILEDGLRNSMAFFEALPSAKWDYRYAEGKWSIKEVLLHMIDTERVFAYRALRTGRHDATPSAGFDQDVFAKCYRTADRTPASLLAEYRAARTATIELFRNFSDDDLSFAGVASEQPVTALALGYMAAGHELHHIGIIQERYL